MRTSYPYYQLAKRYNKDYTEVLKLAEKIKPNSIVRIDAFSMDMLEVAVQHQAILDGKRDWLDGYNI